MKRKNTIRLLSALLVLCVAASLAACGGSNNTTTTAAQQTTAAAATTTAAPVVNTPVVIKYPSFQVGVNSSAGVLKKNLEVFEAKYGDKIKIEVEEIPGDQAYVDKMKILLSANDLPDLVYAGGYNLLDMSLEKGDTVVDLTPYLDADPNWKSSFDQITLDFNSRDGKIYSLPDEKGLMGYYYNKELFAQAGVEPAKTWNEFFEICDKLLAAGITPVSMDTDDSAWLTNLWLSSMLGVTAKGGEFLTITNPTDYNFPEMIDALTKTQRMFMEYSTKDAVGGKYENGANNFLSGNTAMIANGPWMSEDFADTTKTTADFIDKVGVALYPEGGIMNSPMLGYFVASKDKVHADATVEALKFFTSEEAELNGLEMIGRIPASTKVVISDAVKADNALLGSLLELLPQATYEYNYYQALWYQNVLDAITSYYPDFARGNITPADMAQILTDTASQN